MKNWTVFDAVYRTVCQAVDLAVPWDMDWAVFDAVYWDVNLAVYETVTGTGWTAAEEPRATLNLYLMKVAR